MTFLYWKHYHMMYLRYSQIHQIRIWIHQTQYLRYTKSVSQKRRIRCIWLYLRYTSDTYLAVSEMYLRYTRYSQIQPDMYPDTYPVSEVPYNLVVSFDLHLLDKNESND